MTQIAFHFNVPDKVAYSCRLLRKAVSQGSRLVVTGDSGTLESLNQALWTFSAHDFVPHCMGTDADALRKRSPVILASDLADLPHREVLVNLGRNVPAGFEAFARLIELVSVADADRDPGRVRWKYYREQGFDILREDIAQKEPA
jgi:DNA polymerase III subunit chi